MGIGVYRDNNEQPIVYQAVREAEKILYNDTSITKENLPPEGN